MARMGAEMGRSRQALARTSSEHPARIASLVRTSRSQIMPVCTLSPLLTATDWPLPRLWPDQ